MSLILSSTTTSCSSITNVSSAKHLRRLDTWNTSCTPFISSGNSNRRPALSVVQGFEWYPDSLIHSKDVVISFDELLSHPLHAFLVKSIGYNISLALMVADLTITVAQDFHPSSLPHV
ncbi:hypothetical protein L1987_27387 [Smallanthus sonchifolius]|uniref:Uncharacterized protein n=1 Tax=Smallanthus sonchifolius TaxID=185202 RepID=A0ACB9IB63_9ASTR|nr:hypothetical protein L1987_27387 [Smallanthus sonchifolius]